jgi:hypothetical protein
MSVHHELEKTTNIYIKFSYISEPLATVEKNEARKTRE